MKPRLFGLLAILFLAFIPAFAQQVKVEKYTLPNGMTVILLEDHSLPVATINTWYRVGAQDEPPGRSGFAHLFEHLMFMGTSRVPGNQFDVLMETAGGSNNASTDLHRTNYYSEGPASLLPTLLWLDADRLEDLGNTMTVEKLDKQRDIVRNELRQGVENGPYGKADEMVFKLMYPPTHPYYYGVIGTHQDLEAANVTNVKDFFATFYVPNNASLVVAGDFDSAKIKPLVADLFGTLQKGPAVTRKYEAPKDPIPNKLAGVKRFTTIDKVELPRIEFSYHSPTAMGPGDAEMDLAAYILASGKSSRLYKRLVIDDKLASDVSAAQQSFPLGSFFQVDVYTAPDADLNAVEKAMDEELARFVQDGPTAEELDRQKAILELGFLNSMQNLSRKADRLNEYEYYWGEPNSFERDLARYRKATPAAVKEWSGKTLTPGARAIIRVLPEEPQRAATPRDHRPADEAVKAFTPPTPASFTLPNGLTVHLWQKSDLPLAAFRMVLQPGGALDPADKPGLSSIGARMLGEGAGERDALAFNDAVQSIGGTFRTSADQETVDVSMTVLGRNVDKGLALFSDALQRPRFEASDWDRVKRLTIDDLNSLEDNPRQVAGLVADRMLYGDGNPYARPALGTVASVVDLTIDDVKGWWKDLGEPSSATLLVAGNLAPDEAKTAITKAFGGWKGSGAKGASGRAASFAIPPTSGLRVAILDRPNATQTVVHFQAPGVKFVDGKRTSLEMLNTILGGSFTSRLNSNLREEHGYTYGARSNWAMGISNGDFSASASVVADKTGASLKEFLKEFDRLKAGDVTAQEADKARETTRNDKITTFEGLSGTLSAARPYVVNKLPFDTLAKDLGALQQVQAGDLNALARNAVALDQGVLVLVGDKKLILPQLADLKLPQPIEVDSSGEPVAAAKTAAGDEARAR